MSAPNGYSDFIYLSGFGLAVPSTDVIVGITVTYDIRGVGIFVGPFGGCDSSVKLGTSITGIGGTDHAIPADQYSGSTTTPQTRGNTGDTWGLSLLPSDVNASTFGVAISCGVDGNYVNCTFELLSAISITISTIPGTTKVIPLIVATGGALTRIPSIGFEQGDNSVRF